MAVDYGSAVGSAVASPSMGNFSSTARVSALLCRLDTSVPGSTGCAANPPAGSGEFAVTLIANAAITGEDANAVVRQSLSTFRIVGPGARVPLAASGTITGLGGAEIVASDEAAGPGSGVRASIWSPCPVDIEAGTTGASADCPAVGGGGIGSAITCGLAEFDPRTMSGEDETQMLTTCSASTCGCPGLGGGAYSGHSASLTREGIDILDVDGGAGALPDITYFPKEPYDNPSDPLDDSMFEMLFGVDVVNEGAKIVRQTCGPAANEDCELYTLHSLGAKEYGRCSDVPARTGGLIWVGSHAGHTTAVGQCSLPDEVGTPDSPVVLVLDGNTQLQGNFKVYGIVFLRSSNWSAELGGGSNNGWVFGSTMVEGTVNITGMHFVYSKKVINAIQNSQEFLRFGRVPGSWLDSNRAQ